MIEYLCDGRVNVVETINGANILTLNRTAIKAKSRDFFLDEIKKTRFHYQKISRMKILTSQDTSKKGTRKKVHLGNRLLLLRKLRSEDFIYFVDKAWRCGLVGSGYKSGC